MKCLDNLKLTKDNPLCSDPESCYIDKTDVRGGDLVSYVISKKDKTECYKACSRHPKCTVSSTRFHCQYHFLRTIALYFLMFVVNTSNLYYENKFKDDEQSNISILSKRST